MGYDTTLMYIVRRFVLLLFRTGDNSEEPALWFQAVGIKNAETPPFQARDILCASRRGGSETRPAFCSFFPWEWLTHSKKLPIGG